MWPPENDSLSMKQQIRTRRLPVTVNHRRHDEWWQRTNKCHLFRLMNTLKGDNSFVFLTCLSSAKVTTLTGNKNLSFKVNLFSEGTLYVENQTGSRKSCLHCCLPNKIWREIYQLHPVSYKLLLTVNPLINLFIPNGFFYLNSVDRSISIRRDVWLVFLLLPCFIENPVFNENSADPDQTWSGFTLFSNVPFIGR